MSVQIGALLINNHGADIGKIFLEPENFRRRRMTMEFGATLSDAWNPSGGKQPVKPDGPVTNQPATNSATTLAFVKGSGALSPTMNPSGYGDCRYKHFTHVEGFNDTMRIYIVMHVPAANPRVRPFPAKSLIAARNVLKLAGGGGKEHSNHAQFQEPYALRGQQEKVLTTGKPLIVTKAHGWVATRAIRTHPGPIQANAKTSARVLAVGFLVVHTVDGGFIPNACWPPGGNPKHRATCGFSAFE